MISDSPTIKSMSHKYPTNTIEANVNASHSAAMSAV